MKEKIASDYKNQCDKLSIPANKALWRNFDSPIRGPTNGGGDEEDSESINIVFKGNDKLNFSDRMRDKDLIILCQVMENYKELIRHVDLSYNEITNTGCSALGKFLNGTWYIGRYVRLPIIGILEPVGQSN